MNAIRMIMPAFSYPLSSDHFPMHPDLVQEDEEIDSIRLLDITDAINDRLAKAEALAQLLQSVDEIPEGTLSDAALVLADLIHKARELHTEQWNILRKLLKSKGGF